MMTRTLVIMLSLTMLASCSAEADLMIVGVDEKTTWENGQTIQNPPGNDLLVVLDITDRESPHTVASLDLINSIYGPPTNLIITPDETLALVANPMNSVVQDDVRTVVPDNKLYIVDLEGTPRVTGSIDVGQQPSGLDLTHDGQLLFIGNRAEPTVTVVRVEGKSARVVQTVEVSAPVDAISVTPDGKRAVFVMRTANMAGILHVDGLKVVDNTVEYIPVGIEPYNVAVSPKGDIALVVNAGTTGGNDGHSDPVCVIDLTAEHPRVIDWITVGDGPEGLTFNAAGDLAAVTLIHGTQNAIANPATAWAAHQNGMIALLAIDGKTVRKVQEIEVGGMPEGIVFSPDGSYLYVGNFQNDNITILRLEGGKLIDTGKTVSLPGAPAAMRGTD